MRLFSLLLLLLASCARLKPQDCNYDFGFATGVNDARDDLPMRTRLDEAQSCNDVSRRKLMEGYREGYSIELRTRVAQSHLTKPDVLASEKLLIPECRVAYGERRCGYGCLLAYGELKCAKNPGSGCLAAFGEIRCGRDCETMGGRIQCKTYE